LQLSAKALSNAHVQLATLEPEWDCMAVSHSVVPKLVQQFHLDQMHVVRPLAALTGFVNPQEVRLHALVDQDLQVNRKSSFSIKQSSIHFDNNFVGKSGPTCAQTVDPCAPNPCMNGGTCMPTSPPICLCTLDFTGDVCQTQQECEKSISVSLIVVMSNLKL